MSDEFGKKVCEAIGLDPGKVSYLELRFYPQRPVQAGFETQDAKAEMVVFDEQMEDVDFSRFKGDVTITDTTAALWLNVIKTAYKQYKDGECTLEDFFGRIEPYMLDNETD